MKKTKTDSHPVPGRDDNLMGKHLVLMCKHTVRTIPVNHKTPEENIRNRSVKCPPESLIIADNKAAIFLADISAQFQVPHDP